MIETLNGSDYLAGASMIVAIISACAAISARNEAKRQADAMVGELAPVFSAHQPSATRFSSNVEFVLSIENRNFRPLNITRIEMEYPADIVVFKDNGTSADLVLAQRANGQRRFDFEPPLRVGSRETLRDAAASPYTCQWKTKENRKAFDLGIAISYAIDGRRGTERGYASVRIFPPGHDW